MDDMRMAFNLSIFYDFLILCLWKGMCISVQMPGSPGTRITDGCEPLDVGAVNEDESFALKH